MAESDGAALGAAQRGVVSGLEERSVEINGRPCRVWEQGRGETLGVLLGSPGAMRWSPFLEALAAERRVVVPSIPGFPGGTGHDLLDTHVDWIAATLDLLEAAGLQGADLVGTSAGGTLASEAAIFASFVKRLVLVAPFGLWADSEPVADGFAVPPGDTSLMTAAPEKLAAEIAPGEGVDPIEYQVTMLRTSETVARLLWPTTDTGVAKRLHRITVPTLVLWGSEDRLIPASYAKRYADAIAGPTIVRSIEGAGHLAHVDAPEAVASAILEFLR